MPKKTLRSPVFASSTFRPVTFPGESLACGTKPSEINRETHELDRFGFRFMAGILFMQRVEAPAHLGQIVFVQRRHDAGTVSS